MKLKDHPDEWRKQALLPLPALAILGGWLCWRQVLPPRGYGGLLACLGLVALAAVLRPGWFRGYYRWSMRLGFWFSRILGRVLLTVIFFLLLTPLGWGLRIAGKDMLRLRRPRPGSSHWHQAKDYTPLDSVF